jgi:hypothetical protein
MGSNPYGPDVPRPKDRPFVPFVSVTCCKKAPNARQCTVR